MVVRIRHMAAMSKRKLRAGIFLHPSKSIWCICYYVNRRPHWEEIGTRLAAIKAYRARKTRAYQEIEKTKRERHPSFPKPFHSGVFEHPPASNVWWIGYYFDHSRKREKIGPREAANEAWATHEQEVSRRRRDRLWGDPAKAAKTAAKIQKAKSTRKQKKAQSRRSKNWWADDGNKKRMRAKRANPSQDLSDKRSRSALDTWKIPAIAAAREAGRKKGVAAAADPEVRARSLARKMRAAAAAIGTLWTDEQTEKLFRELLHKELSRRRPPKRRGRKRKLASETEPSRIFELVEQEIPSEAVRSRSAIVAARYKVAAREFLEYDTVAKYHEREGRRRSH